MDVLVYFVDIYCCFLLSLIMAVFGFSPSSSGASVVAIDNKIEQAMVSVHTFLSFLFILFYFLAVDDETI